MSGWSARVGGAEGCVSGGGAGGGKIRGGRSGERSAGEWVRGGVVE